MSFKRHYIFASGVHRKSNPEQAVWPPERVHGVYESSLEHSPVLIPYTFRHPENNLPVLGYAERDSLEVFEDGGRTYLSVVPKEMATEFLKGLKKVGISEVSIGLGLKGEIVHIGFTDNPAVTGLGSAFEASATVAPVYKEEVEFQADDLGLKEAFEVDWKWRLQIWMDDVASVIQRIRDREIDQSGIDAADKFIPPYMIEMLKVPLPPDVELENGEAVPTPTYEEDSPMTVADKKEMDRLIAENAILLTQVADETKRRQAVVIEQFCADHVTVVTPRVKPQVVAILTALQEIKQPLTFEEDGKSVEQSAYDVFCTMISGAKPAVSFETVATSDKAKVVEESSPGVDPVQLVLMEQFEAAKAGSV